MLIILWLLLTLAGEPENPDRGEPEIPDFGEPEDGSMTVPVLDRGSINR